MNIKKTPGSQPEKRDESPLFLRRYEFLLWLQIILLCSVSLGIVLMLSKPPQWGWLSGNRIPFILYGVMTAIFISTILLLYSRFINPAKKLTGYILLRQRKVPIEPQEIKKIPQEWKPWFNIITWLFERMEDLENSLDSKKLDQQIGTNLLRRFSWVFERNEILARELKSKNVKLEKEIALNKISNRELKLHRDHLDDLVKERAADLYETNKQLEAAIKEAHNQAEIAKKANLAKSQFLANVSHEIRTPLNSIIGFTDLLADTGLNPHQRDFMKTVTKSSDALLNLINDILDLSKIEADELVLESIDFSLELLAYDVLEMIRPAIGSKPIELVCRIEDGVPSYVKGDATRVRQILLNLVGNATKFTEDGEILLSIHMDGESGGRERIHFKIKDSGIGISRNKLDLIFDPFQQADGSTTRKYGGTGLGLPISKKLAIAMGGDISVESDINIGSVFHFTAWFEKSDKGDSWKMATAGFAGKQALIVDDNQSNLDILRSALESAGIRVADLRNGMEVLATLERAIITGNLFDCCIIDIRMPGMDGYEIARKIRASKKPVIAKLPLIAASSSLEHEPLLFANAGYDQSIIKPVRREKLFQVLNEVLKGNKTPGSKQMMNNAADINAADADSFEQTRILVAEDSPDNRKLMKIMLENAGCVVTLAENGRKAVDTFLDMPHYFDLILMDIQMPEMDGFGALNAIREKGFKIPIIALTAHASKEHREECIRAGMDDYLTKPIKKEALKATLIKHVKRKHMNRKSRS
ncbi:MAG: response regulator [Desulfosalsimonadaceae bacterium]|nr:response regulator [Desulfosalsimonadaceae bacterium]